MQEPEGGVRAHEVDVPGGDEGKPGAGDGRRCSRRRQRRQRRPGGECNAGLTAALARHHVLAQDGSKQTWQTPRKNVL